MAPQSIEELASCLAEAAAAGKTIELGGTFSKRLWGGPANESAVRMTTAGLTRVLQYEPRDLTISVEAGMKWSSLTETLAGNRQMIPLDPPFDAEATVGGVIATNGHGARRRLCGTARDQVIGMKFATLEGKVIQSGGMVVKNVAGLDMAKLLIGSWGTLAAIGVVNFKLSPMPEGTRTFVRRFLAPGPLMEARDAILRSVLQPAAVDLLNPAASVHVGLDGWTLLVQAAGNAKVLDRYSNELAGAAKLEGEDEAGLWRRIHEFTPAFLAAHPRGLAARVSAPLNGLLDLMQHPPATASHWECPMVARAGNGLVWVHYPEASQLNWKGGAACQGAVEAAGAEAGELSAEVRWPEPGSDFAIMENIKRMFDPQNLLNRGRLYGRI